MRFVSQIDWCVALISDVHTPENLALSVWQIVWARQSAVQNLCWCRKGEDLAADAWLLRSRVLFDEKFASHKGSAMRLVVDTNQARLIPSSFDRGRINSGAERTG
jgi:hypothetical protein